MNEFQALATLDFEIHISHGVILSSLFQNLPVKTHETVDKIIGDFALGSKPSNARHSLLSMGLTNLQSDMLQQFLIVGEHLAELILMAVAWIAQTKFLLQMISLPSNNL